MEYFDIRTPDGKVTGKIKERSLVHRDGDLHGTSHIWLVRKNTENAWEVLLQKRSACKDSHPGEYDISSAGHLPAGQDFLESALRELEEELGIKASAEELQFIGWNLEESISSFHGKPWHNHELSAVYVLYRDVEPEKLYLQEEEVESVRWMEYEECLRRIQDGTLVHCISLDEFKMLGDFLSGQGSKNECHAHPGQK